MTKKITALLIVAMMVLAMIPVSVSAAEAVPANTVVVSSALTGASGSTAEVAIGDKTYTVTIGTTGFSSLQAALDAAPVGGTVMLAAGNYTEGVTIKKDVTILGPKAGIDPNVKGTKATDAWARNPKRGEGEAVLKTSWHMGINANTKEVFDCHNITVDGIAVGAGGMFRSNFGNEGYITINYKNILVTDYTQNSGNGPFYCTSYYPDRATNLYKRYITCENIRFENQVGTPGFNLNVESFDAKGIYFDEKSTGEMFRLLAVSDTSKTKDAVEISITDSMFRQKVSKILNCNLTEGAQYTFNNGIGTRQKITVTIENNVFANNDSGAASNNNIIVPQIKTDNIYFVIKNNTFIQEGKVSDNFIAIHGATGALALGEKFTVTGNRFVNIPTALSMANSTSAFDLSGNYFAIDGQNPQKPIVSGPEKSEWWYLDYDMKTSSENLEQKIDATFVSGTVDKTAKTIKDSVAVDTYKFEIKSSFYNTITVYSDKELTNEIGTELKLTKETTTVYVKVSSSKGTVSEVYTATITTSKPDKLAVNLATDLRFFGRTYVESGIHFFNWSSSGFTFTFKGSGAKATLVSNAPGGSNTAYIKIYVDGVEQPDVALTKATQEVVLASGLDASKEHTIKVVKRTNARSSSAGVKDITLTDGSILAPTPAKSRLIEFIGDSITVGYATVANGKTTWGTDTEDSTKTYSEQIANAFDADYMVTAISGRGIVRNTGGDTDKLLPAIYPFLDQYNLPGVEYDFKRQPDVIVINLGTNDASGNNSSLTAAEFRTGLKAFLKDVRKYNPNAEIIYAYGLMTTKYTSDMMDVVDELKAEGDSHISFLKLPTCQSNEKAIGHPTAEAYVSRGELLITKISQLTGWKAGEKTPDTTPEETTTANADTTPDPAQTTAAAPVTTELQEEKGCGSSVAAPTAVIAALASAAALIGKKKKDNE